MGETFPRTADLPTQSPLFWVDQKDRYLRQLLIRDIEVVTKRRLVVYFANRVADAQIETRDVGFLRELWGDVGSDPVDLLLETSGGYTDATEALVALLQSLSTDLRVVVPAAAKSNGTLICLAARAIVMGAGSELGPVEPLERSSLHVPRAAGIQAAESASSLLRHRQLETDEGLDAAP